MKYNDQAPLRVCVGRGFARASGIGVALELVEESLEASRFHVSDLLQQPILSTLRERAPGNSYASPPNAAP